MGKRQRRREREKAKKRQAHRAPVLLDLPAGEPRLRVVIKGGVSRQIREVATCYWEINPDGTWVRNVASIGDSGWVSATATAVSHALLLNVTCAACDEPLSVPNRATAVRIGGKFLDRPKTGYGPHRCPECNTLEQRLREQERQRRAEETRAAKERERAKAAQAALTLAEALDDEEAKDGSATTLPFDHPLALAIFLVLVNHAYTAAGKPLPSLNDLGPLGWTGDLEQDEQALLDLYYTELTAISAATPEGGVFVGDDGTVRFRRQLARWRLVGDTKKHAAVVRRFLMAAPGQEAADARRALADLVERMDITSTIAYLDGLLTLKYGYPAVPEARRQELADIVRKGFAADYTPGQMTCFAWRAADTAAAWKERNRLGPPEAASAAVTILNDKIDKAVELRHAIPEYDAARWHTQPAGYTALRQLNADVQRVHDRKVIAACPRCDHNGWQDTGANTVSRCVHPPSVPEQAEAEPDTGDT